MANKEEIIMTQEMFLEFDDFKLEVLREKAYELDLNLETYLSCMIEDMVSLNPIGKETESEKLMEQYVEKKWEDREAEPAIERFNEEYSRYIRSTIEDYEEENPDGNLKECIDYVLQHCSEYIYEEMEFNCDRYIKQLTESLYSDNNWQLIDNMI